MDLGVLKDINCSSDYKKINSDKQHEK